MKINLPKDLERIIAFDGQNNSGYQMIVKFDNGFGASIINNIYSHTRNNQEFELAVIEKTGEEQNDWQLCYTTYITDDVIGYLPEKEVIEILYKIKDLKV